MKSNPLEERVRERIAELETQKAEELASVAEGFDALIGELKGVLGEEPTEGDQGNGEEGGTPFPDSPKLARNGQPKGRPKGDSGSVLRIRNLLAAEGPLTNKAIIAKTGLDGTTVGNHLRTNSWFRKLPGGKKAPWELTEEGRAASSTTAG